MWRCFLSLHVLAAAWSTHLIVAPHSLILQPRCPNIQEITSSVHYIHVCRNISLGLLSHVKILNREPLNTVLNPLSCPRIHMFVCTDGFVYVYIHIHMQQCPQSLMIINITAVHYLCHGLVPVCLPRYICISSQLRCKLIRRYKQHRCTQWRSCVAGRYWIHIAIIDRHAIVNQQAHVRRRCAL